MDVFHGPGDIPLWHYFQSDEALREKKKKKIFHVFVDRTRKGVWLSGSGGQNRRACAGEGSLLRGNTAQLVCECTLISQEGS